MQVETNFDNCINEAIDSIIAISGGALSRDQRIQARKRFQGRISQGLNAFFDRDFANTLNRHNTFINTRLPRDYQVKALIYVGIEAINAVPTLRQSPNLLELVSGPMFWYTVKDALLPMGLEFLRALGYIEDRLQWPAAGAFDQWAIYIP